jgi:hypothetical protein
LQFDEGIFTGFGFEQEGVWHGTSVKKRPRFSQRSEPLAARADLSHPESSSDFAPRARGGYLTDLAPQKVTGQRSCFPDGADSSPAEEWPTRLKRERASRTRRVIV